ncbi:MAG: fibronectin type III domain-containing protein [Luteolibacter sp.]
MIKNSQNPKIVPIRPSFLKLLGILGLAILGLLQNSTNAATVPLTLGWDAVSNSGVVGYKLYVGLQSQLYNQSYAVAGQTSFTVTQLEIGETYYFAVSAIDSAGIESDLSFEIIVSVNTPPLPTGGVLARNGAGQIGLQWSLPKSALITYPVFNIYSSPDLVNWTKVDTVQLSQSTAEDANTLQFAWPIPISSSQMFFRLNARNWLGDSTVP